MPDTPHTLRAFDEDLDQLRASVSELGGRVEAAIASAIDALIHANADMARVVVDGDAQIDALAEQIERDAIRLIALRHPLADDLREVLAALKIANSIERMGDCAANIGQRAELLCDCRRLDQQKIATRMGYTVSAIVTAALDAYVSRSGEAAEAASRRDREVDELYACMFSALVEHMGRQPHDIGTAMHLMFVGQKLERIEDHAAIIARIVHFAVTGEQRGLTAAEPAAHRLGAAAR